jgi:hypothetical protein
MFEFQLFGSVADVVNDKPALILLAILFALMILFSKRLRFEYKGRDREWSLEASKSGESPRPKARQGKPPKFNDGGKIQPKQIGDGK